MYRAFGYDDNYHVGYYTKFTDSDGKIRHVIVEPILKGSSLALSPQIHEIKIKTLEEININEKEKNYERDKEL